MGEPVLNGVNFDRESELWMMKWSDVGKCGNTRCADFVLPTQVLIKTNPYMLFVNTRTLLNGHWLCGILMQFRCCSDANSDDFWECEPHTSPSTVMLVMTAHWKVPRMSMARATMMPISPGLSSVDTQTHTHSIVNQCCSLWCQSSNEVLQLYWKVMSCEMTL